MFGELNKPLAVRDGTRCCACLSALVVNISNLGSPAHVTRNRLGASPADETTPSLLRAAISRLTSRITWQAREGALKTRAVTLCTRN